jgi:hypothetical protein
MIKTVSTGYEPRPLQAELHRQVKRFNVISCHRRFGKTHFAINEMIDQGFRNSLKSPQYAYVAPTYGQAKRIAWDILKNYLKDIPFVTFNEGELRADIERPAQGDRIRFYLLGAENPDGLRGMYLDGCVLDEFADMDPTVWSSVVRPLLSDRKGWVVFIGTPKGQNHFYDVLQTAKRNPADWHYAIYKASETGIIDKAELEAARAIMSENEYMQEFECSFSAALIGAYFGKEIEKLEQGGRITGVPYDLSAPVITGWDLGMSDTTCIWFAQIIGREIHIIDYLEQSGMGLDYYVKALKDRGYNYDEHLLPHDADHRELGTGKSRVETLRAMGLKNIRVVPRTANKADDINAARLLLNKCWFDADKTAKGLEALKNYSRRWDAKNKIFQERPNHNWASHGADAFQTLAVGIDENRPSEEARRNLQRKTVSDFDIFGGIE